MSLFFVLGPGHVPVPVSDNQQWMRWMASHSNRVARDEIAPGVMVSTIFLGIDHGFGSSGPPVLFETMVFDDYGGGAQLRYCTWDEAVAGHREMVEMLRVRIAERLKC